ncbi:MAG: plasmid pRiA4b ORF-3 family protein [Mogibacterium sp.]|nr:plasmid pRiA4b ORF-3 family protein [Mogibacterium sp.]
MTREDLYSLAFRYRKTKLWLRLLDTQVFAARTEKNETLFISIIGRRGEHISVAVYPENEFYSYYHLFDAKPIYDDMMTPDTFESFISSSCIQCSFEDKGMMPPSELEEVRAYASSHGIRIAGKNAFPIFSRYTPYKYPWIVNSEHDLELLAAGVGAAIALSDELDHNAPLKKQLRRIDGMSAHKVPLFVRTPEGYRHSGTADLPTRRRASYPSGNYSNEEVLRKIRSKRQKGIIDCRVTWLNNPVQDHPDDAPYYPVSLIAVEESDGTIMSMSLVGDYESEYNQLLSEFMLNLSARKMRPKKILVQNARTFALLAEAMKKASINIGEDEDLPLLDAALFALDDYMAAIDADDAWPDTADVSQEAPLSYVISISPYTGCFRHIRVSADITLEELHNTIQDIFEFDNNHLYAFFMDDKAWSSRDAYFSPDNQEGRSAAKYRLRDIALFKGKKFLYLFDFGDEWRFECRVLRDIT